MIEEKEPEAWWRHRGKSLGHSLWGHKVVVGDVTSLNWQWDWGSRLL